MYWLATRDSSWRVPARELVVWSSHQWNQGRAEVPSRRCWAEFYTPDDLDVNEQALSFCKILNLQIGPDGPRRASAKDLLDASNQDPARAALAL
jgi:hypothetical protein